MQVLLIIISLLFHLRKKCFRSLILSGQCLRIRHFNLYEVGFKRTKRLISLYPETDPDAKCN